MILLIYLHLDEIIEVCAYIGASAVILVPIVLGVFTMAYYGLLMLSALAAVIIYNDFIKRK